MGNFSRNTFDRLKRYVSVRLQQGVPLVDADWNEQDDIRKYELQAFIKWFVGNGVPRGNDGFRILAAADTENDFAIQGGDGTLEGAGRCVVEGWDIINESAINYTAQSLYENPDLAADWGVAKVDALTPPPDDSTIVRTDLVYVDVWEREVNAAEDFNHLVNPAIGIETCVRLKREWAVRVAVGTTTLPTPPLGHVFYALATLKRVGGVATIPADVITDLRQTGLNLASLINDINDIFARLSKLENAMTVKPDIEFYGVNVGSSGGRPFSGTFSKIGGLITTRPGTYVVFTHLTNPSSGSSPRSGIISRVYVNDVPSPQSQEHSLTRTGTDVGFTEEFITVEAGDIIQLYGRKANPNLSSEGVFGKITLFISNPFHPTVYQEEL